MSLAREIEGFARYAVYWSPPPGSPLGIAGAAWLGWDAATGCAAPPAGGALVDRPRRYGFHATLKAPFRLAPGATAGALAADLAAFAAASAPAGGPALGICTEGRFAALRPTGPCPEIDALAAACLARFEPFRAAPSCEEVARRRGEGLDPRGEALLARWGYPHVAERFRFHLTVSGPLPETGRADVAACLRRHFGPHLGPGITIDALSLFGDPGGGAPFRLLARHPLGGPRG